MMMGVYMGQVKTPGVLPKVAPKAAGHEELLMICKMVRHVPEDSQIEWIVFDRTKTRYGARFRQPRGGASNIGRANRNSMSAAA
jgi:hypothetical protein